MTKYRKLITEETWTKIIGRYNQLVHAGLASKERKPFLPVGEPDFGKPGTKPYPALSVAFCGIAGGHVDGDAESLDDRILEIGTLLNGADRSHGSFWREIFDVRDQLKQEHGQDIHLGWANILAINNNRKGADAPNDELVAAQKDLSLAVWSDLITRAGADVVIATFNNEWFDLADPDDAGDDGRVWEPKHDGKLWLKRKAGALPHLIWVNHVRGRTRKSEPKAADITATILSCFAETTKTSK